MRALRGRFCAEPQFSCSAKYPHGPGRVFEGEPGRLEHPDLGYALSRRATGDDRAGPPKPVLVEAAHQQVAALEACNLGRREHHPVGGVQGLGVRLALLGEVRACHVDDRTGEQLSPVEDRLGRTGGDDEHVGAARGGLGVGRFDEEANVSAHLYDDPVASDRRAFDHEYPPQTGHYPGSGLDLDLTLGLPTGTEDGERLALNARPVLRGDRAGRTDGRLAERVSLKGSLQLSVRQTVEQKGEVRVLRDVRPHYVVAIQAHRADARHKRSHAAEPHASNHPSAGGQFTAPPRPSRPKASSTPSMTVGMGRISLASPHAATQTAQGL
jgi:hypothetical protein